MSIITLTLPVPPSVWDLYVGHGRRKRKSQKYRDWLDEAGFYLMQQTFERGSIIGAYVMDIKVPMKLKGDISNRTKAPEDCLVAIGVIPDDKHAFRVSIERANVEDCEVTVRGIKTAEKA
jgi:crossover junction endodeoxyribonuclease RusA